MNDATSLTAEWTETSDVTGLPAGAVWYGDGQCGYARLLRAGETVEMARAEAEAAYESEANVREVRGSFRQI